ncbi:MAG TPA: hypothetical protein VF807_13440 [Ktedonobacterales bacterium]
MMLLLVTLLFSHTKDILAWQRPLLQAAFSSSLTHKPARSSLQGLYEECRISDRALCLPRLTQMGRGGFDVVLNYDSLLGSAADVLAYADQAQRDGLQVIWSLHYLWYYDATDIRPQFSALAATCACSDNASFIAYIVGLVRNLPATWGYYVGDEVQSSDHAVVMKYAEMFHQLDPTHPRLYVADAQSNNPVWQDKSPFFDTAEVIGDDHYPVGRAGYSVESTAAIAKGIQSSADRHKVQPAIVLQSFSFKEYSDPNSRAVCSPWPSCTSFPTRAQMGTMLSLTLSNSRPRLVLWYSFFDIMRSDAPAQHWNDLVAVVSASDHAIAR